MKIFELIDSMSCLTRWSQAHCTKKESVLEHTAFVTMYAYYLCCKHDIENKEDTLIKAIVHDIDEIVTGDIPHPTKYNNKRIREEIEIIEQKAAHEISRLLFQNNMYDNWRKAKDLSSDSGCIVAISDCASVIYKIWQEINIGNKSFLKFIPNVKNALNKLSIDVKFKFMVDVEELILIVEDLK